MRHSSLRRAAARCTWRQAATFSVLLGLAPQASAQDTSGVSIDFGAPPARVELARAIPDSVLQRALARFNDPATLRSYGGAVINAPVAGSVAVFDGDLRIGSQVEGDVVVINGSLRLDATARITGAVIVLGGRFYPDPGASFPATVVEYNERAAVRRRGDATLEATRSNPSLRELAGRASFRYGNMVVTPRLNLGVYNRTEGLPVELGPSLVWQATPSLDVTLDADLILRTAREEGGSRGTAGWRARLAVQREGDQPLGFGLEGGDEVVATADRGMPAIESSISALVFRRDQRDWYGRRRARVFAEWLMRPTLQFDGGFEVARERSLPATEAFSILRSDETWRANPLVDDGRFTTIALGATWNSSGGPEAPRNGWWIRMEARHTTSGEFTPYLLPEQLRDPLPSEGYGTFEGLFDLRRFQRIDPRHAVHLRLTGQGWLGGDPLTIQRRVGLGGSDFLSAYPFRTITCDPRRRADPAMPALCDRRMMAQAEFRRTYDLGFNTRIGPYGLGIDRADLIIFTDWGSAWVAGDGPGQVPVGRIQSLSEWRGAVGIGADAGWFGIYLSKSITDDESARLSVRLQPRF
jgi:hypothetical protein